MAEPVIADAVVTAGHDGEAALVVRVRYENGALGTVTLDADRARKLMEDCAAESADGSARTTLAATARRAEP